MGLFQKKYWERKSLIKRRPPQHPVIENFVLPKIKEIRKIIPIKKETTLLDVGCGNGFFSYWWDKICDTTGVDYSETMINLNPITKKYVMSAEDLKFPDSFFDIVFCNSLLYHVENINKAIDEMRRVSRKYLIISEPNAFNPLIFIFSVLNKQERRALKFSLGFLKRKIDYSGVKIISAFSHGVITPNKTPSLLLPLLKPLEKRRLFGVMNIIITKK
jgi:SAM-dependent methyltransferase